MPARPAAFARSRIPGLPAAFAVACALLAGARAGAVDAPVGAGSERFRIAAAAVLEMARTDPARALAAAEDALANARREGDRAGQAELELAAGECLDVLGRDAEATGRLERARSLYAGLGDDTGQLHALRSLGALHRFEGRFDPAVAAFEAALAIARRSGSAADRLAVEHELLHSRQAAAREQALERQRRINELLVALVVLAGGAIVLGVQRYRARGRMAARLDHAARHDPLTGLSNRRDLMSELAYELARSRRSGRPFAVMIGDLDDFKAVNDRHGHEAGDAVLVEVARRLRAASRSQDVVGRWGGEEFLFVLPETDADGGRVLGGKVHRAVGATPVRWRGEEILVTLSLGVSESAPGLSVDEVIRAADEALLEAKRAGKNRVHFSGGFTLPAGR